jgi:conjugative transfer region protein TrbK
MQTQHGIKPQDVLFVALGVVVGAMADFAVQATCDAEVALRSPSSRTLPISAPSPFKPSEEEFARCRNLPLEKADDPACRELWAKQRLRFLAPGKAFDGAGKPLDMFPAVPNAQEQAAPATSPTSKGE